jgi:CDP-glucose 4,6-dehydratase
MERLNGRYGRIKMVSFWEGRNVLITGGTGFVGSWLTKQLYDNDANVIVLVRDLAEPQIGRTPKIRAIVKGDLLDYDSLLRIFNEYEIDTCYHLAAQAIVGVANRNPISTFETNIKGTWNILEAARNSKLVKRIIVASSDKAYGKHDKLPYTEEFELRGLNPYDASKACEDILARTYHNTYGMPIAVTRFANIYGGGDFNFSRIIPDTIRSLLLNKPPIIRSDGTPIRDYVYISDVVNAYLLLAEKIEKAVGNAFNFGTNKPISVLELVNLIIKVSGKNITPTIEGKEAPKGEIDKQFLDSSKVKRILGWEAKVPLQEGLKHTYEWYKENIDIIKKL